MARKLFIILLFIAGLGLIFFPLASESPALRLALGARPSTNLPRPWRSGALIQVLPQPAESSAAAPGVCAGAYTVQQDETLGQIAQRCAVPLQSLLSANRQVSNPNRIDAGQVIAIPALAGRGGGNDLTQPLLVNESPRGYTPGAVIAVYASGLPASVPVRVGIGLSSSGYRVLEQAASGADGSLSMSLTIPTSAQPGERAFILVTASGVPSVQVISPEFIITSP